MPAVMLPVLMVMPVSESTSRVPERETSPLNVVVPVAVTIRSRRFMMVLSNCTVPALATIRSNPAGVDESVFANCSEVAPSIVTLVSRTTASPKSPEPISRFEPAIEVCPPISKVVSEPTLTSEPSIRFSVEAVNSSAVTSVIVLANVMVSPAAVTPKAPARVLANSMSVAFRSVAANKVTALLNRI